MPTPTPAPTPAPPTGGAAQPTAPAITGMITASDATLYGGIIVVVVIIAAAAYLKFFRKRK